MIMSMVIDGWNNLLIDVLGVTMPPIRLGKNVHAQNNIESMHLYKH